MVYLNLDLLYLSYFVCYLHIWLFAIFRAAVIAFIYRKFYCCCVIILEYALVNSVMKLFIPLIVKMEYFRV